MHLNRSDNPHDPRHQGHQTLRACPAHIHTCFLAAHTAQTSCASGQHFQWRPPLRPRRPCRKRELAMTRRTRLHDCLARCTASSCRVPSRLTFCAASDASEHLVQSRWLRRVVAVPCCASSDSDACQKKFTLAYFQPALITCRFSRLWLHRWNENDCAVCTYVELQKLVLRNAVISRALLRHSQNPIHRLVWNTRHFGHMHKKHTQAGVNCKVQSASIRPSSNL